MLNRNSHLIAVFTILALPAIALGANIATETWDDAKAETNGWVANTQSATVVYDADGGNPDGHIKSRRGGPFDIGALIDADDSEDFTGDFAGINMASFDAAVFGGEVTDLWLRFRTAPFENGWRYPFVLDDEEAEGGVDWDHYSVGFNPGWSDVDAAGAGWIQEDGAPTFATVMAAVDTTEVRFAADSTLLVGIDNFSLVPEPGSGMLWLTSLVSSLLATRRR